MQDILYKKRRRLQGNPSSLARAAIEAEIKDLESAQAIHQEELSALERAISRQRLIIEALNYQILALESICLIHGIYDINVLLAKGPFALEAQATQDINAGIITMPYGLLNKDLANTVMAVILEDRQKPQVPTIATPNP